MFHLSYYNISHRLSALTTFIRGNQESIQLNQRIKRLRMCENVFNQICEASVEIASAFSFSVLVILTILIIVSAAGLFFCLYSLVFIDEGTIKVFVANFIRNAFITLVILISANSPMNEVGLYIYIYTSVTI